MKNQNKNTDVNAGRGSVLIIVLWFVVVITFLVATLASETRLAAQAVFYNKAGLQAWAKTLHTLRAAEMELMIQRMPPEPKAQKIPLNERKNPLLQFDGRLLNPVYEIPKGMKVRIYDHAGKISLKRLSTTQFRQLLEKRIGKDPRKIDALYQVWQDWRDRDDLKHLNGAEKEYYKTLSPPYKPRNTPLETVEELLLLKDFAEVFKGVNLHAVFTVYGNNARINPNLASAETLALIPKLDETAISEIISRRGEDAFKRNTEFNEFMKPEQLTSANSWFRYSTGNYYTIAIQADAAAADGKNDKKPKNNNAYTIIVQARGYNRPPKVLRVQPHGALPDTSYEEKIKAESEEKPS
ncbi:MAG: general secretion pathway protein GspK [Gammaproteobacteria bacterium]|nr:general secretion pathway protein GspK [Gammaproteobacteria bacterium]